jgi:hypothetical protein
MNMTTIKCRKCPSHKLAIFEMGSDYPAQPIRVMAVCKALNVPLNFEKDGDMIDRPTKQDATYSRIIPDSNCPKVRRARSLGIVLWPDLRINPDGSTELWIQDVNY